MFDPTPVLPLGEVATPVASLPGRGEPGGAAHHPSVAERTDLDQRFERLLRAWWLDERPDWTCPDWWEAPVREEVRALLWLAPGPGLAAALVEASIAGPCPLPHRAEAAPGWPSPGHAPGWPCACQVVVAAAWEACGAWVAASSAAALVEAAGPDEFAFCPPAPAPRVTEPAREELALALRVSPLSMGNRIAAARELIAHPGLAALVASAAISAWSARLVVREVAGLPEETAGTIVAEVVQRIRVRIASGRRPWTSAEVGRAARALRLRLAADEEQTLRQHARADRRVQVFEDRHGMAVLHAVIDATSAVRIHRRLSAIAHGLDDPERSRDQARADVLVDLLLGSSASADRSWPGSSGAADCAEPAHGGHVHPGDDVDSGMASGDRPRVTRVADPDGGRPQINVVVSLATLLALAEDPAEVPGLGPIPQDLARALAADGRWRAWITDASGTVVATGSGTYVPSDGVARLVRAREPYCRMPGCRRAAERCDLDHAVPWPMGATSVSNLGPLCRRHHVLKTHAGWALDTTGPPDREGPEGHDAAHELRDRGHDPPGPGAPREAAGESRAGTGSGWTWRTPAGFTVHDAPDPALS